MSPFFAALGTIFGTVYFALGDFRVFIAALLCFFMSSIAFTSLSHRRTEIFTLFSFFLVVFFNYNLRAEYLEYFDLEKFLNAREDYILKVVNFPKERYFRSELILEIKYTNPNWKQRLQQAFIPYRLLAYTNSSKGIDKGDIVELDSAGKSSYHLERLKKFKAKVHKKDKVYYKLINDNLVFVSHQQFWVDNLQKTIKSYYYKNLSHDNAQIITSLLLGSRVSEIPQKFIKQVRDLGLGHFFAASGFHLVTLSLMLLWFCRMLRLDTGVSSPLIIVVAIVYAALAGFSPSIIRAGLFVIAYFLLDLIKRRPRTIRLMVYMAGIVLLIDPYTIFDLGFQFSYLATLAILLWTPLVSAKLEQVKFIPNYFRELLTVGISVQLFLLPLVMYYFDILQIWAVLANFIFTPFLALLIVLAFTGLYFLIEPILNLLKYLIDLASHLPLTGAHVVISFESMVFLVIALNFIAFAIFKSEDLELDFNYSKIQNRLEDTAYDFIRAMFYDKYARSSIIIASLSMFLALNLHPPLVTSIVVENGLIRNNQELQQFYSDDSANYKYFKIKNLDALVIKKRDSLKRLESLLSNLREVNILLLPKLNSGDIYFDTLVDVVSPQFIISSITKESPRAMENMKILGSKANTIINSGVLYIGHNKFWSIRDQ